jgi:hypothetical protein
MNTVLVLSRVIINQKIFLEYINQKVSKPIFPLKGKSDYKSMHDVRSYAPK